jgi:ABC-type glycerol-3-phosphate transport system substrate-binding protein
MNVFRMAARLLLFVTLWVAGASCGQATPAAPTAAPAGQTAAPTSPPDVGETPAAAEPAATAAPSGEERSITVWGFVWTADWLDEIAPGFEAEHPGVTVNVERFEYDPYQDMVLTTLASGTGVPDVVTLDPMWAGDLIRNETLLPLDKAEAELNPADFVPGGWNMYQWQGVQYGIPLDLDFNLLFYRKDVYDAAMQTLGQSEFPTSTEDFLALAKQVTADTGKPAVIIYDGDYYAWYQSFLAPMGGNLINDEGTEYVFNSDVGVDALQLYSDVVNEHQVGKLWNWDVDGDPMVALQGGDAMAVMHGSWFATELASGAPDLAGKWGIAPVPWGDAGREFHSATGGACLSTPAQAKEPELAWEFIKYAMTPESQASYFRIVAGVPSLKTSWTDPAFDEVNEYFGIPLGRSVADWSLGAMPMQLPSLEASDLISEAITRVLAGEATPKEALDEAVSQAPPLE